MAPSPLRGRQHTHAFNYGGVNLISLVFSFSIYDLSFNAGGLKYGGRGALRTLAASALLGTAAATGLGAFKVLQIPTLFAHLPISVTSVSEFALALLRLRSSKIASLPPEDRQYGMDDRAYRIHWNEGQNKVRPLVCFCCLPRYLRPCLLVSFPISYPVFVARPPKC